MSPPSGRIARLVVHPGGPLSGDFAPPGDKSITHRAYVVGLLAEGETVVVHGNPGDDCARTLACAEALGARAVRGADRVAIAGAGAGLREPEAVLDCGNSGTTLRLLAGVLASRPFLSVLAGDASLHRRPVDRVIDPLRRMGANLSARGGDRLPPLVVRGRALKPVRYDAAVASAQVATCVVLAGLAAEGETSIALPGPARDHTERMLPRAGIPLHVEPRSDGGRRVTVRGPAVPKALALRVPGDFSAAAFFLAAAAARPGATVTARDVSINPTRAALLEALEAMGAGVTREREREEAGEPLADVTVRGPDRLRAFEIPAAWVPRLIDDLPAWTIAAAAAVGTSRVRGAGELRVKESDRLAALAAGLGGVGVRVRELPDGIEIEGGPVAGGTVDAEGDHRIAMTFATLGTIAAAPITVSGAGAIQTSFPDFAEVLGALGAGVEADGEDA